MSLVLGKQADFDRCSENPWKCLCFVGRAQGTYCSAGFCGPVLVLAPCQWFMGDTLHSWAYPRCPSYPRESKGLSYGGRLNTEVFYGLSTGCLRPFYGLFYGVFTAVDKRLKLLRPRKLCSLLGHLLIVVVDRKGLGVPAICFEGRSSYNNCYGREGQVYSIALV